MKAPAIHPCELAMQKVFRDALEVAATQAANSTTRDLTPPTQQMSEEKLLTFAEAARELGVPVTRLVRALREHRVPCDFTAGRSVLIRAARLGEIRRVLETDGNLSPQNPGK